MKLTTLVLGLRHRDLDERASSARGPVSDGDASVVRAGLPVDARGLRVGPEQVQPVTNVVEEVAR